MMQLFMIIALALAVTAADAAVSADMTMKPDPKRDCSAAIQKALDAAAAEGGGRVFLPAGSYRMDKPISIPSGVTLAGTWEAPHHAQLTRGTVLLVYAGKGRENDPPLVKLAPSSAISGITFFYPEQTIPAVPYPWTIQGEGMHGSVINVTLVNPYKGIDFGTNHNELHYIRNIFGCPLKVGVYIDRCTDIGRVENVHFNPHYWMRAETENKPKWEALRDYLFQNCVAFDIGRSDWEYILNTFSFGCKVGYRFFKSPDGPCNGNFLGIAADWAKTAVLIEETQMPGLLITNGEFVGGEGAETMIEVRATHQGLAQFSNCSFWGPSKRVAMIDGPGMVSFNQCNFVNWEADAAAIEAMGGDLIVQSCKFTQPHRQIALGQAVKTAVIVGNRMAGELKIENNSKGDVQIGMNVVSR